MTKDKLIARILSVILIGTLQLSPLVTYADVTPAENAFDLQVTVDGNTPSDEEYGKFKYYFDEIRRPGTAEPWVNLKTARNGSASGNGDVYFGQPSYGYEDEGAHWYRFYEDQGAVEGYTLDQTVFYLKVIVQGDSAEYRITDYQAYKGILGADIIDADGWISVNNLTKITPDDMVFANGYSANELAAAKEKDIAAINAKKNDVNASVADAAIEDIKNAKSIEELNDIYGKALSKMQAAEKKVEFQDKIKNELLPAAKCDEAKAILNKAVTDLNDAETLDQVNSIFYNAQGQAMSKDSEFTGMLSGYTNAFKSALTDVATDETKGFVSEMLKALNEATSIAKINEIYNTNKDKISVCINRDKSIDGFNKYIDSDKYSDDMKGIAEEAVEKLLKAESTEEVTKITKEYMLKLDVQLAKEEAKKAIDDAVPADASDAVKAAADKAKKAIDAATTIEGVEAAKKDGLKAIEDAKNGSQDPVKYIIINGANSIWTKGSDNGLQFRSNAAFAKFDRVKVDGKTIAETNYTAKEGSTIIELKPSYLETLKLGKHSIEIASIDGSASTNFIVKPASGSIDPQNEDPAAPQTGDGSNILIWMTLLAASGVMLIRTVWYKRKRI